MLMCMPMYIAAMGAGVETAPRGYIVRHLPRVLIAAVCDDRRPIEARRWKWRCQFAELARTMDDFATNEREQGRDVLDGVTWHRKIIVGENGKIGVFASTQGALAVFFAGKPGAALGQRVRAV